MNHRRFVLIVALVTIVLAVAAWRTARANHAGEVARLALAARRAELTSQLQHWEAELAAAKQRSAERVAQPVVETPPAMPAPAAVVEPAGSGPRAASSLLEWMEDPKVQVLHYANERAGLAQTYGPFFQSHHLTPAQIEKLSDLIIQSRAHNYDLSEINRTKGISFNDPAMVAQRKQGEAEVQAGMTEVLGESGYTHFKDYARALEVRTFVGKIAGAAAVEGMPINREQAEALVQALANACPMYSLGAPANLSRIDWKGAEAQAQGILTPSQMKLLRTDTPGVGPSRTRTELGNAVFRARSELSAAGRLPGG